MKVMLFKENVSLFEDNLKLCLHLNQYDGHLGKVVGKDETVETNGQISQRFQTSQPV